MITTYHVEEDGAVQRGQEHPEVEQGERGEECAGGGLLRVQRRLQPVRPAPLPRHCDRGRHHPLPSSPPLNLNSITRLSSSSSASPSFSSRKRHFARSMITDELVGLARSACDDLYSLIGSGGGGMRSPSMCRAHKSPLECQNVVVRAASKH